MVLSVIEQASHHSSSEMQHTTDKNGIRNAKSLREQCGNKEFTVHYVFLRSRCCLILYLPTHILKDLQAEKKKTKTKLQTSKFSPSHAYSDRRTT